MPSLINLWVLLGGKQLNSNNDLQIHRKHIYIDGRLRKHLREINKNKVINWINKNKLEYFGPKKGKLNISKFKRRPKVTDIQKNVVKLAREEVSLSVKKSTSWF